MILSGKRIGLLSLGVLFLGALISTTLLQGRAWATGLLEPRKFTLEAGATDAGSKPGGTVKYKFDFTTATTASIGSIDFKFCTTASGTCNAPTGLDIHSASLTANPQTFTLHTPTISNSEMYITRTAASIASGTALSYEFSNVVNPSAANTTFYAHITTYTSTDASTGATDSGTVAASTANQIVLSGYMPESLIFCTGGTIGNNGGGIPDCSTASSGSITLPDFSPTTTSTATSQMAASTNANTGYAITVNGTTLTSGSNTVTAMTTAPTGDASVTGTSQFGMNLVANTTPTVGTAIYHPSNGGTYNAEALTGYASADHFRFVSGDSVADSSSNPSDIETYTVSYIVNVNGAQPVGTYTSTLTYICTPTY